MSPSDPADPTGPDAAGTSQPPVDGVDPADVVAPPTTADPVAAAAPSRHPVRALLASAPIVSLDRRAVQVADGVRGNVAVDRILYGLSEAANHSMLWHGINLVDAVTGSGDRRRRAIRRSVVIATEQALVNGPVKWVSQRERPVALADHPHTLRKPRSSSFPSGHSSAASCAATMLSRDLGMAPLWWSLAGAVAWSRVHVGVHHASDVVAGVAVGRLLANGAARVWPPPGAPSVVEVHFAEDAR